MENPVARRKDLVMQAVSDELLIYDLRNERAYCLNRTSALVWKFCDGTNGIRDIIRRLEAAGAGRAEDDLVWAALGKLDESGLLDSPIAPRFQGQSRRQVLKALGRASAVALPLVAALVVPARSAGIPPSCGCNTPASCLNMPACPSTTNCNQVGLCAPN